MSRAFGVIGLGYGDEGKGTIVDYLCRQTDAKLVVRHNGGPQAAHNVVTDNGHHHTFSQFGAGTLTGARTLLSRFVAVDPLAMEAEAAHLSELDVMHPLSTMSVDARCLVITPLHRLMNLVREISRRENRHGSCGVGFGEAVSDALAHPDEALRIKDFTLGLYLIKDKLAALSKRLCAIAELNFSEFSIRQWARDTARVVTALRVVTDSDVIAAELRRGDVVFEGAQGMLLDEDYGFHPHTTWSHTGFQNMHDLLVNTRTEITHIGVTRSFATRHGAGPFVTEDETQVPIANEHNSQHAWQGSFRTGALDLVALNYATIVTGWVNQIALTHVDMITERCQRACVGYRMPGMPGVSGTPNVSTKVLWAPERSDFEARERFTNQLKAAKPVYENVHSEEEVIARIEDACRAPVKILSRGPRAMDKSAR